LDKIFDLQLPPHTFLTDTLSKLAYLCERFYIVSKEETSKSVFYNGYWLDKKYWQGVDLPKMFNFRDPALSTESSAILSMIESSNAVAVHIRRGDYQSKEHIDKFGIFCPLDYYRIAIERIFKKEANPCFFIFSDDIAWVKANLCIPNAVYVDCHHGNDSWKDMFLMSKCRHNIIANSTFSFWAAMLNTNPNKVVVYPQRWYYWSTPDIFPETWLPITEKELKRTSDTE
jgi:Glycosyl transferase family 11.